MRSISRQFVRMALLVILIQVLSPAFIPLAQQQAPSDGRETTISVQHNLLVIPAFLKEKEEKEAGELELDFDSAQILDLSTHSLNLLATHKEKFSVLPDQRNFPSSPLNTLYCRFLI